MSENDLPGLLGVPPHRREETRRRIQVVERYLAERSKAAAVAGAREIGIGLTAFYALAKAWTGRRSAFHLPGAGGPRSSFHALNREQTDVIAAAVDEMPGEIIERIAERAMEIAREREVPMVGWAAVTKHVGLLTVGRLPLSSPAAGADLIVEHVVVDLPVGDPSSTRGYMPLVTIVTSATAARVLGLTVSPETPSAAGTARALTRALTSSAPATGPQSPLSIYMNSLAGEDWAELRRALGRPNVRLMDNARAAVSPPAATIRLIGRRRAGIQLLPRFGRRPLAARPASMDVGGRPMSTEEAEELLRARWIDAGDRLELPIGMEALAELTRALARLAG